MNVNPAPVLSVRDLVTRFHTDVGVVNAVDGISFDLYDGETLGIVGESGSGKTVTALSIMGLIDDPGRIESGEVVYRDENLLEKPAAARRDVLGSEIAMVFQDPMTSLNPVYTVGQQLTRVIRTNQDTAQDEARARALRLMNDVGIPEPEERIDNYPHEFSGGMRQRVLLAMAISCEPSVLIADEPTTALDVTIEAQILDVLSDLQSKYGMSIILITHDLGVIAGTCDRVCVAYAGRIVERAGVDDLFENPRHPYTRGLIRSVPRLHGRTDQLTPIEGDVPNLTALPSGCSFHPRCPHASELCHEYDPELREVDTSSDCARSSTRPDASDCARSSTRPDASHESACLHARGYGPVNSSTATANGGETSE